MTCLKDERLYVYVCMYVCLYVKSRKSMGPNQNQTTPSLWENHLEGQPQFAAICMDFK